MKLALAAGPRLQSGKCKLQISAGGRATLLLVSSFLLAGRVGQSQGHPSEANLPLLTRISQIRNLPREQAALGYPVRVRGVIVYCDPKWPGLIIMDSTGGTFIEGLDVAPRDATVGQRVEVEGRSRMNGFAPSIFQKRLRLLEKARLPRPRRTSLEKLMSGDEDGQWIEVEGTVHSTGAVDGRSVLRLAVASTYVTIQFKDAAPIQRERLVGARVRIRGAGAVTYNKRDQLTGVSLWVSSVGDLKVLQYGPSDPFSIPFSSIRNVLQFAPGSPPGRRMRIQGIITLVRSDRSFFMQDHEAGLSVNLAKPLTSVNVGDQIEAVGFPSAGTNSPVLQDSIVRIGRSQFPATPTKIGSDEALRGDWDAKLIEIEGKLVSRLRRTGQQFLTLQAGPRTFNAEMREQEAKDPLDAVSNGSQVRLRGICLVQMDSRREPQSFHVLLRGPQDVVVVRQAPWWTVRRALIFGSLFGTGSLGALAWVIVLRRRVRAQSKTIYERAQREMALERRCYNLALESEARYRSLVEALPGVVFAASADGRTDYLNRHWYEYTDLTVEESTDFGWMSALHPDDREQTQSVWVEAVHRGSPYDIEYRLRRQDGAYRWFRGRATPLHDKEGEILKWLGIFTDVDDEKKAQDRIRETQKLEAVGRLAGGVAHDFNNLLTAIGGYNSLLIEGLGEEPTLLGYGQEVRDAVERASGLTRQLLLFSRRQLAQPKNLNLNERVTAICGLLHRIIGEDIEIITNLPSDLGIIRADPVQLDQVIMNLAVNARDAMPNGGRLTLETANTVVGPQEAAQLQLSPGDYTMLTASDTGTGMDSVTKGRIFEPFFTTKEQGKGTGLGLSIVYGVIRQSGGCIMVDSAPGKGTTFKIYLPVCAASVDAAVPETAVVTGKATGQTVLLVEDESVVRRLVAKMLQKQGYRVLEAALPSAALAFMTETGDRIDLLLSDVLMPEMRGPELAKCVRKLRPDIGVLFMSGYSDTTFLDPRSLEDAEFVQKPFTPAELALKIRQVLNKVPSVTIGTPETS
jgi:PAS domain S-box-containing protein